MTKREQWRKPNRATRLTGGNTLYAEQSKEEREIYKRNQEAAKADKLKYESSVHWKRIPKKEVNDEDKGK